MIEDSYSETPSIVISYILDAKHYFPFNHFFSIHLFYLYFVPHSRHPTSISIPIPFSMHLPVLTPVSVLPVLLVHICVALLLAKLLAYPPLPSLARHFTIRLPIVVKKSPITTYTDSQTKTQINFYEIHLCIDFSLIYLPGFEASLVGL